MEGLGSNLCNHIVKEVIKHSENRLRLWHVSVPLGIDLGYDSHDSFVVACYTENEARNTSPNGLVLDLENKYSFYGWIDFEDIPKLIVTEIGYAKEGISFRSVIIASFNAG
jgi:hypothetical protein